MDALRLRIGKRDDPAEGIVGAVEVLVNGRDLRDLAKEVESSFAAREGKPHLAGDYVGLPAEAVFRPSRRLLGEPEGPWDDWGGRISILGCGCGVVGCWPLQVGIVVQEDVVVWDDFAQPYRLSWDHSSLGPFIFDRGAYEAELRRAHTSRM